MKSLKRTLCLVLALVMVLGLFGIASATSFTDDNTIQYKEAVDVMTGIGAINGMGDGTFNPKGTITRAQAAKLVTYAVLGKDTADRLVGSTTSSFSDVTVAGGYGWAIPSIEYLVKEGIINGMGDGTFNPQGNITGIAVLKMLLCSIGYGAKGEYTGTGWDLQVVLDANKVGLTAGRTSTASVDTPATREEVALYCFNAIQRPKVEYIASLDIYNESADIGGSKDSIAKSVYGLGKTVGDLKKTESTMVEVSTGTYGTGTDAFGAPATIWSYKGVEIGKYAAEATFTYTTKKTATDLTKELKGYTMDGWDGSTGNGVTAKINGKAPTTGTVADGYQIKTNANLVTALAALTGNGTVVKVYANDAKVVKSVIVIRTEIAKVTTADTTNKQVALASESTARLQANYSITAADQEELYAKAAGLKKDDYVLITPVYNTTANAYAVASFAMPTQITGKITNVTTPANIVTVTGSGAGTYGTAAGVNGALTANAKDDVNILLDSFGFIIHSSAVASAAKPTHAYVLDAWDGAQADGRIAHLAKVVFSDGTVETIPTSTDWTASSTKVGTVVELNYDDAAYKTYGTYVTKANTSASTSNVSVGALVADKEIKTTSRTLGDAQGDVGSLYFAPDVKFIYADATTKTATVKTGVQAVNPTKATMSAIVGNINPTGTADWRIVAVYLPNEIPTDATLSGVVFLAGKTGDGSAIINGQKKDTYSYAAFVDGVKQADVVSTDVAAAPGFYLTSKIEGVDGIVKLTAKSGNTGTTTLINPSLVQTTEAGADTIIGATDNNAFKGVNLAGATVVDLRSADAKLAAPIAATPEGVVTALRQTTPDPLNLMLAGVVDNATQTAKVVYILNAGTTLRTVSITGAGATGAVLPTNAGFVGAGTVTITFKTGSDADVNRAVVTLSDGSTSAAKAATFSGDGNASPVSLGTTPTAVVVNTSKEYTVTVEVEATTTSITIALTKA